MNNGPTSRAGRLATWIAHRHWLAAGLIDSSLASLATFAIGVFAVRVLTPVELGAYALAYQAVFFAGILPMNIPFTAVEVAVVTALRDPEGWLARGKRAAAALQRHAGATDRSVALIQRVASGADG